MNTQDPPDPHRAFDGLMSLNGLRVLRRLAVKDYEAGGGEDGYRAMALVCDLALARLEKLETERPLTAREVEIDIARAAQIAERHLPPPRAAKAKARWRRLARLRRRPEGDPDRRADAAAKLYPPPRNVVQLPLGRQQGPWNRGGVT